MVRREDAGTSDRWQAGAEKTDNTKEESVSTV